VGACFYAADVTAPLPTRDLGARGSRATLADPDPAGSPSPAAAGVLAAVPEWWAARAEQAGLSGRWWDVAYAVAAPVPAPALDAVPDVRVTGATSSHDLGAAYVTALTTQVRARHGRHYTPAPLSQHLWSMTRRAMGRGPKAALLPGLVRDPACGAGSLLLPVVREHVLASVRTDPQVALAGLANHVEGIDADPAAVWLANVVLAAEALPLLAAVPAARRRAFPALARTGDGLATARPARAVVMNPPYGRVRLSPNERTQWAGVLYGHANLYGLFMGSALDSLDDDGVLAALVPTSFTSGLYFSRLRGALSRKAPLREVAFVSDRDGVFTDVLQETCLAVFTRRRARRTTIDSVNGKITAVAQVKAPRGEGPWLLPRRADDAPVAAVATSLPLRLRDVGYRCSTGPLVWNRRADDLGKRRTAATLPVLWAADLDGGVLHRDKARDGLRFLRLRPGDDAVMVLSEPAVLVQRTTAPEQIRRLVAAELTPEALDAWGGRVVVENHVNVLRPTVPAPLLSQQVLAAVLASPALDRVMRCLSGSVAVSAYELEAMPLPDAATLAVWDALPPGELPDAIAAAYRRTT
jgi:adenine-specific DNA-methyltransferase